MTIEQKARAYDEAIKKASAAYGDEDKHLKATLERIFPELKEPKDDKMREMAIKAVYSPEAQSCIKSWGINPDDVIAWLEKQGEPTDINPSEFDLRLNKLLKQFETLSKEELASSLSFYLNVVQKDGTYKHEEKQGEQKPDKIQLGKKYKCIASPRYSTFMIGEIYKPKDKFLCGLMNFCYDYFEPIEDGEQNPADKVEPRFHEGGWITNGDYTWKIVEVKPLDYILQSQDGNIVDDTISHVDEQFHSFTIQDAKDGDVLASELCDSIILFKGINDDNNIDFYCDYDFSKIDVPGDRFTFNNGQHYGNVEDSKDFHPATKEQRDTLMKAMADAGYTFDFDKKELKKIEQKPIEWHREDEQNLNACLGYIPDEFLRRWLTDIIHVKYDKSVELPKGEDYGIDGLYAAIDILQKALGKVDGYQTDDGILEHKCAITAVKKLYEQKPTELSQSEVTKTSDQVWSEEDDRKLQLLIAMCDETKGDSATYSTMYREMEELKSWLKSIKDRVQPKQEWSEEDEDIRDTIIRDLKRLGGDIVNVKPAYKEEVGWLKSLEQRIGWKPSEEQMKALHDLNLTGNISYAGQGQVLIELYNDLKKL